jgi:aryl-alcohol dehydrogenase-like predicted oxidoreductase
MGIETIDLIQVHWPDPSTADPADDGGLLEHADGREGVRAIGVSNFTPAMMAEAQASTGRRARSRGDQPKVQLSCRAEIEKDVLPWCRDARRRVVVYSPLDPGLLTGKVPDGPHVRDERRPSHAPDVRERRIERA